MTETGITMNAAQLKAYIRKSYSGNTDGFGAFYDCFSQIRLSLYGETITIYEYKKLNEYLNFLEDRRYESGK